MNSSMTGPCLDTRNLLPSSSILKLSLPTIAVISVIILYSKATVRMPRWLSPGTHNPVVGLAVVESVEPVKIAVNKRPNVVAIAQPAIGV